MDDQADWLDRQIRSHPRSSPSRHRLRVTRPAPTVRSRCSTAIRPACTANISASSKRSPICRPPASPPNQRRHENKITKRTQARGRKPISTNPRWTLFPRHPPLPIPPPVIFMLKEPAFSCNFQFRVTELQRYESFRRVGRRCARSPRKRADGALGIVTSGWGFGTETFWPGHPPRGSLSSFPGEKEVRSAHP